MLTAALRVFSAAALATLFFAPATAAARSMAYTANLNHGSVAIDTDSQIAVAHIEGRSAGLHVPENLAISPDGTTLYIANSDGHTVTVIDTASFTVSAQIPVGYAPRGVAVSPDGRTVYVANFFQNTLAVVDAATNTVTTTVAAPTGPTRLAVSPNGARLYVAHRFRGTISVFDTSSLAFIYEAGAGSQPNDLSVSPDGMTVFVSDGTGLAEIDAASGTLSRHTPVASNAFNHAFSHDRQKAYVAESSPGGRVFVIDIALGAVVNSIGVGGYPNDMEVTPDGRHLYVTRGGSFQLAVIDTDSDMIVSYVDEPVGSSVDIVMERTAVDSDGDGVPDHSDNCPGTPNPDQADADGDGAGDACDPCPADPFNDGDGDILCEDNDNCPTAFNPQQEDTDRNGVGDACNEGSDFDGDEWENSTDNCPSVPNDQANGDGDYSGDACDVCSVDPFNDRDGDGYCGNVDNCEQISNNQQDTDGDLFGDACDADDDDDGVLDADDNCPLQANASQIDRDGDGDGDVCDRGDTDHDSVLDGNDQCLATVSGATVDADGCSIPDLCPCDTPWKNHGAYVSCVARAATDFVDQNLITSEDQGTAVSEAGASACGKR